MNATGTITMSMTELDRLKVVQAVCERRLKPGQAADRLALSVRQVERLVRRYQAAGVAGLVSGKRGRPGNHQLADGVARRSLAIIRERYADFGPTLACEKLRECHGIGLAVETVRVLMMAAGLWIPRRDRPAKVYQPRNRRACLGELIQIDGSDHRWFEERAPACTLLVFIDDATGRLMTLHFTATESTFSYFEALAKYLAVHGKPVAFYSDKFSVFYVKDRASTAGKGVTQFGRALYQLNIEAFCANTSQAKGRVERANLTLQDRLVKELRLRNISTREAANAYAPSFIADFNRRFGKPPKSDHNVHRPLRDDEDLRQILAYRVPRKVTNALTVQYDRVMICCRTRCPIASSFTSTWKSSNTPTARSRFRLTALSCRTRNTTGSRRSIRARRSKTSGSHMCLRWRVPCRKCVMIGAHPAPLPVRILARKFERRKRWRV